MVNRFTIEKKAFQKGSLDLDMNELKIYVDKEGYAERLEKQENDISHQLIEEFMLVANEQVGSIEQARTNRFGLSSA